MAFVKNSERGERKGKFGKTEDRRKVFGRKDGRRRAGRGEADSGTSFVEKDGRRKAGREKKSRNDLAGGRRFAQYFDYPLMASVILLLAFGLIMLYSASYYNAQKSGFEDLYFFKRQLFFALGAVGMMVVAPIVDYHRLYWLAPFVYLLAILAMAAVHIPGLGHASHGSLRWLSLFGISFQPAELGKVAVIVALPVVILKLGKRIQSLYGLFILFLVVAVQAAACMILTDNLSTALIIVAIGYLVVLLAYPRTKRFLLATGVVAAVGVALMPLALHLMEGSFRLTRIRVWLNPAENLNDGGWQVMQALYAIGSGGFFGKGLGNSTQKLGWIPEAQNDMIFSIVCEELGIFGALLLLGLFLYLIYRLYFIAQNAPDLFGSLLVAGVTVHIAIQVILNISVVLNVIPTTGVTLPLVSYGGTALLIQVFEICFALSVSRRIRFAEPSGEV